MRIGIDLGGSKIEVALLSPGGGVLFRHRIATPRRYPAVLEALVPLVRHAAQKAGKTCSIGLAIPGTISPATGLVKNANSTWLNGKPLAQDLVQLLGQEVRIANDANCFALSEAADGAGAGAGTVFGVILGTGVGGGLVVDGNLHTGANAIAGEWGHNPLPWPAPEGNCRVRDAGAGNGGVSRRFYPVRDCRVTMRPGPPSAWNLRISLRKPLRRIAPARPASCVTRTGLLGRWPI